MKELLVLKVSLVVAALFGAGPSLACSYEYAPEPIGGPSAKFIAPKMAAAATFVDLAVAEGESRFRGPDGKVVPWSKAVSFRVLRRWKGASPDRFILFGGLVPEKERSWDLTHWVDDQGRIEPFESVREAPSAMPTGMTSCDPPSLSAKVGHTYVILREADGRLLGAVEFHAGKRAVRGTAIAEADLWPDNEWARQISYTAEAPRIGPAVLPQGTPDPTRATVRFRRPLTAAAASELLRRTGAQPFAVTLVRSGITSDYRLGSDQAWLGLVSDAAEWASKAQTDRSLIEAQARTLVDAYPVRDVANDTAKREHARMVLALAVAPAEQGPALVTAIGVVANSSVQRALAARSEVAEVIPAVRVRNRVASAPPVEVQAGDPLPQIEPVELHRRLTAIAGKDIPESRLQGTWRLAGSYSETYDEEVMRLRFDNGQVIAILPCVPDVSGTYRFAGQVLELDVPKPSLKACPQRSSFWTADFFFGDSSVLTVRLTGDTLLLVGTGGEYRFVRA